MLHGESGPDGRAKKLKTMRISIGVTTCYNTETKEVEGYNFLSDPLPQIDFAECELLDEKQVGKEIRFSPDFGSYVESEKKFLHTPSGGVFTVPSCVYV